MNNGILISNASGLSVLTTSQTLPVESRRLWDFVADPMNLARITPAFMNFIVTGGGDTKMYPGQIITYWVSPFPLIRVNWITEITHVDEGRYFVDEQRHGPFDLWHHEHLLVPRGAMTDMIDRVSYRLPLGPLGGIINSMAVRSRLTGIFTWRRERLAELLR